MSGVSSFTCSSLSAFWVGLDRPFIIEMVGLDNLSEVRFDIMKFCCCCLPNIGALAPTDPVAKSLPYLLIILAGILVVTVWWPVTMDGTKLYFVSSCSPNPRDVLNMSLFCVPDKCVASLLFIALLNMPASTTLLSLVSPAFVPPRAVRGLALLLDAEYGF